MLTRVLPILPLLLALVACGQQPVPVVTAEASSPSMAAMPFDLARTAQTLSLVGNGGVLDVVSTDGDPKQIALIRSRLRERGQAFVRGDIPTPALFPQGALPGMTQLGTGAARVAVRFKELPTGGRLSFTTQDFTLLPALSLWLAMTAQKSGAGLRVGIPPDAHIPRENTQ